MRRSLRNTTLVLSLIAMGSVVQLASGADAKVDAEAKKLQQEAMDVDFFSNDLKKARNKLQDALKKCASNLCEKSTVAAIHRDLGVILINGKDVKGGKSEFETALALEPALSIPKDFLENAEVKKAWDSVRAAVPVPATTTPTVTTPTTATTTTPTTTTTSTGPGPSVDGQEGNISLEFKKGPKGHEFPVILKMPDGLDVGLVKVWFRASGMEKYQALSARKDGKKWVTEIGCEHTQFPGEIKVYVKAYDAEKTEVEKGGSVRNPMMITLVEKMGDKELSPTYPGDREPKKCKDKDCPPGFNCDGGDPKKTDDGMCKKRDDRPQGSGCKSDCDCEAGLSCVENDNGSKWCYEGTGAKSSSTKAKRIWVGLHGQLDMFVVPAAENICLNEAWACSVERNGQRLDVGVNDPGPGVDAGGIPLNKGFAGKSKGGGFGSPTGRVMASFDYLVIPNLTIGGRLGFAFGGNPTSYSKFFPVHIEARGQYFFGTDPLATAGFKPYVGASVGVAQFDAKIANVSVNVSPDHPNLADDPAACDAAVKANSTDPVPCSVSRVDGYKLSKMAFFAPVAGAWVMFTPRIGLNVGVKPTFTFPTFSFGMGLELGMKIGF